MSTAQPTQEQQATLDRLYAQLKHAKSDLSMLKRTYRNAICYGSDQCVIDDSKQQYALVADEYNAIVEQINELTAPFRAAEREQRNAEAQARREEQQAQQRARLRASTCDVCGLVHAGEC